MHIFLRDATGLEHSSAGLQASIHADSRGMEFCRMNNALQRIYSTGMTFHSFLTALAV